VKFTIWAINIALESPLNGNYPCEHSWNRITPAAHQSCFRDVLSFINYYGDEYIRVLSSFTVSNRSVIKLG
jgi:hypothetical protein